MRPPLRPPALPSSLATLSCHLHASTITLFSWTCKHTSALPGTLLPGSFLHLHFPGEIGPVVLSDFLRPPVCTPYSRPFFLLLPLSQHFCPRLAVSCPRQLLLIRAGVAPGIQLVFCIAPASCHCAWVSAGSTADLYLEFVTSTSAFFCCQQLTLTKLYNVPRLQRFPERRSSSCQAQTKSWC